MKTFVAIVGLALWVETALAAPPQVSVIVGERASQLEKFAASQLCHYVEILYGQSVSPVSEAQPQAEIHLLIGTPTTNPAVAAALGGSKWPRLSEQGILLRPTKRGVIVSGGSPRAIMWAVYELVQRWGVRYLMHGDVLPEWAGEPAVAIQLPRQEVVLEPKLTVRQWRVVNDFACGPESWGIKDYRPLLDQLAKLKFNRLNVSIYPWQPFLDLKYGGVERKQAWLWYDFHYPITKDMPARHLFDHRAEFWNPDLPIKAGYREFAQAGRQHLRTVLRYAKQRGFDIGMTASIGEFPREFAKLLKDHRKIYASLGNLTINPGPQQPMDDPRLLDLSAAVLQQTLDQYPEVDFLMPHMPEISSWTDEYEKAWSVLDRKYGIARRFSLEKLIEAGRTRKGYAAGSERAVIEVKCNICALYVVDKLLSDRQVFVKAKRPDTFIAFTSMAEEVLPLMQFILPRQSETLNLLDYTPERIVARPGAFRLDPQDRMKHALIFTLHDDNVGVLPQLNTTSLATLVGHMRANRWSGFSTRYWMISDHEPCMAYLSRRCWLDEFTPQDAYRDHVEAVCGVEALPDMLTAFGHLETVTRHLNGHGLGLTFPVPGMIAKHFLPGPLPRVLVHDRDGYRQSLAAFERALRKTKRGREYVQYWVSRIKFGIGYIDCIEAARALATAKRDLEQAKKNRQQVAAKQRIALDRAKSAMDISREMLETFGKVARNQSDRGAIAVMVEYVYRPLRREYEQLRK